MHALEGSQESNTIKVLEQHRNRKLLILMDSGSTHSFLDKKVGKEMKIPIIYAPIIGVTIADDRKVLSTSMSRGFSWKI